MAVTIIALGVLFFIGHALNWFFVKTKIPDLLLLVILGFILGPVTGIVEPSDLGEVGAVLSTMALIVILYEGGIHLKTTDLKASSLPAAGLSILGFLLIVIVTAFVAFITSPFPWTMALLLGIGIGSTSSAIVIPMVKPLSISDNTKTVLSLESAFTDVLTIVIFLIITESLVSGAFSLNKLVVGIGPKTALAALLGFFSGMFWAYVKKHFSDYIPKAFANEAWALLTYGVIEASGYNGAIGVLTLGFMLANLKLLPGWMKRTMSSEPVNVSEIGLLKEITFLLRTFFFVYLGMLVSFSSFSTVALALVLTALIFITRYFAVRILLKTDRVSRLDAMVSTAMGPRGLACAVLATLPLQKGLEGGQWLQDVIFALIPMTIFFTAVFVSLSEKAALRKKMTKLFGDYSEGSDVGTQESFIAIDTESNS